MPINPQFVIHDEFHLDLNPNNPQAGNAAAEINQAHIQALALKAAQFNKVWVDSPKKTTLAIVSNYKNEREMYKKALVEYDGYITQKQLSEAINRVLKQKGIRTWKIKKPVNKTEYLSEVMNLLWALIPDKNIEVDDGSST